MLIPATVRNSIYEYLLNEGVMTAVEDPRPKVLHPAVKVRNLYVMNVMKSLASRGYVRKRFAWRTYYWFLTNEGIDYLREVLHLPTEIVPSTLNKPTLDAARPGVTGPSGPRMPNDGRGAYRCGTVGAPETGKDTTVVPEGEINFRG
nr:40S ribosomal protein S10 [Hymenolepis microstoma]